MEEIVIKEEFIVDDSGRQIKEESEDSLQEPTEECEDPEDYIPNVECAVDIKTIKEEEEIYTWNSYESAEEGSSKDTLTHENLEMYGSVGWSFPSSSQRSNTCNICKVMFRSAKRLKAHVKMIHAEEKPYECEVCMAKFTREDSLKIHMRIHTGEKPYECEFCKAKFAYRNLLKVHIMKTHTGERPYECEVCKAKFTRGHSLKVHKRTHKEGKLYECRVCKTKFTQRNLLKFHIKETHTGENPYECEVCTAKFTRGDSLKIHMRIHTGEKPYECEFCKAKFTYGNLLKVHIMKTHTGERP